MQVPDGEGSAVGESIADVIYSWNFPYSRNEADTKKLAPSSAAPDIAEFGNSYLYLLWEDMKKKEITDLVRERVDWLMANVKVGDGAEKELRKVLSQKPRS